DTEQDDVDFVYAWLDRRFPRRTAEEYARLDPPSRQVVALVLVHGQQMNGAFPAVYYNGCGHMMTDAIACMRTIGADAPASIAQAYVDAITQNPYLGPPEVWPTPDAPPGSATQEDSDRVEALDDAYWEAEREFGVDRFWESLAAEARRIESLE